MRSGKTPQIRALHRWTGANARCQLGARRTTVSHPRDKTWYKSVFSCSWRLYVHGLLQPVEEAIAEIIAYRAVRPIDSDADLPMEDDVYRQTSGILEDYDEAPLDKPF